jgi:hypothetical protein
MRSLLAIAAVMLLCTPAFADETGSPRPGVKQSKIQAPPDKPSSPPPESPGRSSSSVGSVVFAIFAAVAIIFVVCFPTTRRR